MSRRPPPPPPRKPDRTVGPTRRASPFDPQPAAAGTQRMWIALAALGAFLFVMLFVALLALLIIWRIRSTDSPSDPDEPPAVEESPDDIVKPEEDRGKNKDGGKSDSQEGKKGQSKGDGANGGQAGGSKGEGRQKDGGPTSRGGQGDSDGSESGGKGRRGGADSGEGDSPAGGRGGLGNGRGSTGGRQGEAKSDKPEEGESPGPTGKQPASGQKSGRGDVSGDDGEGSDGDDENGDGNRRGPNDPDIHRRPKPKAVGSLLGIEAKGRRIAYVVDCSFGITQGRFDLVCDKLAQSISTLHKTQRFIVLLYSDDVLRGDPAAPFDDSAWLSPTEKHIEFIKSKLVKKRPWGKPDPFLGVNYALDLKPDAVFLLAAGKFREDAVEDIREANVSNVPIHTISLFDPSLGDLLRPIAEQNGGQYQSFK